MSRATLGRATQGVSPNAMFAAWFDWASHLARAPGRQVELALEGWATLANLSLYATARALGQGADPPFKPRVGDDRFADARLDAVAF